MKKSISRSRFWCFFLSIVIILSGMQFSAVAETVGSIAEAPSNDAEALAPPQLFEEAPSDTSLFADEQAVLGIGEKTLAELAQMSVDVSALPSFIDANVALQKGHVNRLNLQETKLSTVIYQNKDGSKSTYLYAKPVKYIDDGGAVRDKSTVVSAINDSVYAFAMTDNSTQVYFPKKLESGTKVQYQNYSVTMSPKTTLGTSVTYNGNEEGVTYANVFGANTLLSYQTKLNGVKEDIILVKNTRQNEFPFDLSMTDLVPVCTGGVWYLANSKGETVGSFSEIIITDSAGNSTTGSMSITAGSARGTYTLKVTAPTEFLNAASTVYPVYVDPSIYIYETDFYYTETGNAPTHYSTISDVSVCATYGAYDAAYMVHTFHTVGTSTDMAGRIIYKLYDFYGERGLFKTTPSERIGKATLYVDVKAGTAMTLTASPMKSTWSQTTEPRAILDETLYANYSNVNSSSQSIDAAAGVRAIDITSIVKGWAMYNNNQSTAVYHNPTNGFMLRSNSSSNRQIEAVEYTDNDNDVYAVIDTATIAGTYYLSNLSYGNVLCVDSSDPIFTAKKYLQGSALTRNRLAWRFQYIGNNQYHIRPLYNTNLAIYGNGSSLSLITPTDEQANNCIWELVKTDEFQGVLIKNVSSGYVLMFNGTSLSLVSQKAPNHSDYSKTVWIMAKQSDFDPLQSLYVENISWMSNNSTMPAAMYLTPSNSFFCTPNNFIWESSSNVVSVDSAGNITSNSSDGVSLITVTHRPSGFQTSFYVAVDCFAPGNCYIQNETTKKYVDIVYASMNTGVAIEQNSFSTDMRQRWFLEPIDGGGLYYRIKSLHSNLYIGVDSSNTSQVKQYNTQNDYTAWKIESLGDNKFKIICKATESTGRVLSIPTSTTTDGVDLTLSVYSDDDNHIDEWIIYTQEYQATVNNYYDNGYLVRYNETVSSAIASISSYMNAVAEQYVQRVGLFLTVTSPQYYNSIIDQCKGTTTSENVTTLCQHADEIHTKRETLIQSFKADHPGDDTTTNVLWSGHKIISQKGDNTYENRSCSSGTCVFILKIIEPENRIPYSIGVLFHELNHQYGAPDHYHEVVNGTCVGDPYCLGCNNPDARPGVCIMVDTRIESTGNIPLCEPCKEDIINHLNGHYKVA